MPNHVTNQVKVIGPGAHEFLTSLLSDGFFDFDKILPIPKSLRDVESSSVMDAFISLAESKVPRLPGVSMELSVEQIEAELLKMVGSREAFDEYKRKALVAIENKRKYGVANWHQAHRAMWGTKWNAYDQKFPGLPDLPSEQYKGRPRFGSKRTQRSVRNSLRHPTAYLKRVLKKQLKRYRATRVTFCTAWSTPGPIWAAIALRLPKDLRIEVQFADEDLGYNCGSFTIVPGDITNINLSSNDSDEQEGGRKWVKFAFHTIHGPDAVPTDYDMDENYNYIY